MTLRSRGMICPSDASTWSLGKSEGTGKAGCWLHPRPACNKKRRRQSPQVQPERPGLPCAIGVNGLWRALPGVPGLIATVASRETSREKLDPSFGGSGPHAFAVRAGGVRQLRRHVHRIPHPTFVTTRTPLWGDGTRTYNQIFPKNGSKIFSTKGLDTNSENPFRRATPPVKLPVRGIAKWILHANVLTL